jgi:hypothetical protein
MVQFLARTGDGQHFTLSINGEQYTYTNDKAGKRQAILDGLEAIETVAIGRDVYLPSNAALQAVAVVLYPDGIQSEEAYQLVCRVTEKACAHIGYSAEVELGPPHVPLNARGAYRKRQPLLEPQTVLDELALALPSRYYPRLESNRRSLCNKVAWETYGKGWPALTEDQQAQLQAQVDAAALDAGWQLAGDGTDAYIRPLSVNVEAAGQKVAHHLQNAGGRPAAVRTVIALAQSGAYGRTYHDDELAPELAAIVANALQSHGYETEPAAGEYRPLPLRIPEELVAVLSEALSVLQPCETDIGPALLLQDVLAVLSRLLGMEGISEWQTEQLLRHGVLGQALRKLGYRTELTWRRPFQFRPIRDDTESQQVLVREVRVQRDPERRLTLAAGLSVYAPVVTIDDEAGALVYLEMLGPKQAVKANWAALAGGKGRVHWLGSRRVELDGMKQHIRVQASLPCGWGNIVLIHKQASLKEMNPEQPFYLLDDGGQPIPPLFYPMLNRALALPLLENWTEYLWNAGRQQGLIHLLDEGRGQGYAAWRVLPAAAEWQQVVRAGLEMEKIALTER